jgi:hypothetical protein
VDKIDLSDVTGLPRCARCNMPVQEFWAYDMGHKIVFIAECHGQVEFITMTREEFASLTELNIGSAFATCDPEHQFDLAELGH